MGKVEKSYIEHSNNFRPSGTPESEEGQCIALAYANAKKQLKNGTASSQIVAHFLKQGSPTEKLKKERLIKENELLDAKIKAYNSMTESSQDLKEVLAAFKAYSGQSIEDDDDDFFDD